MRFQSFEQDVIQASFDTPVLVNFWAEWCGPCKVLGPVIARLAEEAEGRWRLVRIDGDAYPEILRELSVEGIPTVKLFHLGREVAQFAGALPEERLRQWLDQHVPSETKQRLEAARLALVEGRDGEAEALLDGVLAADPDSTEARVLLARLRFPTSPGEAVDLVRDVQPGDPMHDAAEAVCSLKRFTGLTESAGPGDAQAWAIYLQAAAAVGEGRYTDALEDLIEVLNRRARDVDDDGARKACIAVFRLLGEDHPVTQEYRRSFSSVVY